MATFVASGIGGFTHDLHLPEYDNVLDLVNRGDKTLLLKLVQEKGGAITGSGGRPGPTTTTSGKNTSPHDSLKASPETEGGFPPSTTSSNIEKKRKTSDYDEMEHSSSARVQAPKAPRTRSQGLGSSTNTKDHGVSHNSNNATTTSSSSSSSAQWQVTPLTSPPTSSASVSATTSRDAGAAIDYRDPPATARPALSTNSYQQSTTGQMQFFPSLLGAGMSSYDIFGHNNNNNSNNNNNGTGGMSSGNSTPIEDQLDGQIKQEDSPPLLPYQDSSNTSWMGAYTNLTPVGGNESFWSMASNVMNSQSQQQDIQSSSSTSTTTSAAPLGNSYYEDKSMGNNGVSQQQQARAVTGFPAMWSSSAMLGGGNLAAIRPLSSQGHSPLIQALHGIA